jgi:hypothetical protein
MTALQTIIKEAKSIKKAYPNRFAKWTDYVKQASAIYASKHRGKSPVGKKKAVKKTTKKKLVKKVGVVKKKVLKKAAPKKAAKKIKKHTHYGKVKSHMRRVNGVTKKPSEKDVLKSIQKAEKIQKSHMSMGSVKHEVIEKLMHNNKLISDYDRRILNLKNQIPKLDKVEKLVARDMIKAFKDIQRELKTHARELKKHI